MLSSEEIKKLDDLEIKEMTKKETDELAAFTDSFFNNTIR